MMIRKRLTEITKSDLDSLIARGAQEDRTLEFKRTLSGRDGNPDPWMAGSGKIGQIAKRDLTKEIIAFANTAGGTLILGMDEDGEKRASGLVPIPACRDLADRLGASIAASIDPALTSLEAVGVELDGQNGVVVLRVPASHSAPHRDREERECYQRIGDRSEPMSMRQVQDLCVSTSRNTDLIIETLNKQSRRFVIRQPEGLMKLDGNMHVSVILCGIRAAAYPLERIAVDEINEHRRYQMALPTLRRLTAQNATMPVFSPSDVPQWRPMLRGLQSKEIPEEFEEVVQAVRYDGLLEITAKWKQMSREGMGIEGLALPVRKAYWVFAHTIVRTEIFRALIGRPELEFALDFEWRFPDGTKIAYPTVDGYSGLRIASALEQDNRVTDFEMPTRNKITDLWRRLCSDLAHSFGIESVEPPELDFEAAIQEGLARAQASQP
ncbi:ATP-binding protein [Methylobacterium sp. WL6]|uniref:AlbA family DNA-binding domain-containing protein n=1 Tax=Methylobacterium sp. WL6 TaxID=2603901 RepID=UPI0011CB53B1|nr:ATP-binding protein [Methylobacterium sp. WL6]TXN68127.1 ATP-binding protein [Methylobacterium sp. WL6]